jgi:NitT/TauT family transport system substrate-binding protein
MASRHLKSGGVFLVLAFFSLPLHAAEKLIPVDVALSDVSINKVPLLIAADAGIYAKNGLDVHQYITPGAAAVAHASGVDVPPENVKADIASAPIHIGGGSPTIVGFIKKPDGPKRVIVSTTEGLVRDHIITAPSIASVQDLKGKRIGYSAYGTVTSYDILTFLKKMGWDPEKDVTLVAGSSDLDSIKNGKVDAILASAMVITKAKEFGLKDLGSLEKYDIPLAGSGVMVESNWLAANRDATARFVKSVIQATALMKTDRKVFNAALAKWFNIKDKQTQDGMFAAVKQLPDKPYPSVAGIKGAMAIYDSPGMRAHKAEEFYDASFVTELDKSGFLDHPLK